MARKPDHEASQPTPSADEVRRRAYLIWEEEEEGWPHGRDEEHWSRAERELAQGSGPRPEPAAETDRSRAVEIRPPARRVREARRHALRAGRGEGSRRVASYCVQARMAAATSSGLSSSARWPAPAIGFTSVLPAISLAKRST